MSTIPFTCPHCLGAFAIDGSMAGKSIACPACGGALFVPDETPPPEPPQLGPPPIEPWGVTSEAVEPPPLDGGPVHVHQVPLVTPMPPPPPVVWPAASYPVAQGLPTGYAVPPPVQTPLTDPAAHLAARPRLRLLSREERSERRFRRNVLLLIFGLAILFTALAFLLQYGGGG